MKNLKFIIYTGFIVFISILLYALWQKFQFNRQVVKVDSTVLLERVEKVFKLVTVEGNFSEIYDYQSHYFADVWPFRKKALVRINARVSVGYDFEKLNIFADEKTRTIRISGNLKPEILSIEDDLNYYNFENGIFNSINNEDVTQISRRAKQIIREKAEQSRLFGDAEEQKNEMFELLNMALKSTGWELVIEDLNNSSPGAYKN